MLRLTSVGMLNERLSPIAQAPPKSATTSAQLDEHSGGTQDSKVEQCGNTRVFKVSWISP